METRSRKPGRHLDRPPRRIYFGWWIVISGTLLGALGGGFQFHGATAFFLPLADEFGTNRGTLSLVFGLSGAEGALLGPFQGWLVDKYGPRRIMLVGITMMAGGFLLFSFAQSLTLIFVIYIVLIAAGSSFGLFSPAFAAVGNWFVKKRATALGIAMSGIGFGALLVNLTNFLIQELDWRGASRVIALIVIVVGYPLVSLMRHRPEQYGLLPDGEKELRPNPELAAEGKHTVSEEVNFTARQALRTQAFWFIHVSFALRVFVSAGMAVHFIPIMDEKGLSATTAAALLGFTGVLSIPSRMLLGVIGDYIDKRVVIAISAVGMGLSTLILADSDEMWQIYVALSLFGVSTGGGVVTFALRGEYYGRKAFATISGMGSTIMVIGTMLGPVYAGYTFDGTGSYDMSLITFAVAAALAIIAIMLARRPQMPRAAPLDAES